ncbi:ArsR family transcriptional regulator (fragment) [Tepidanaerobacter acetatoxydans Re1]|uniref:ArsR family transcriptional regulator n=1 Tax=Tepidanaerobacter acetatoxydans (strain DSM 21804 / JCM 16047 / Re1) TaxID=1209989 RepID=L0S639_TEPAE
MKEYGFIKEILDNELIKLKIYKEDLEALDKYRKSGFSCDDFKGWRNIFQK